MVLAGSGSDKTWQQSFDHAEANNGRLMTAEEVRKVIAGKYGQTSYDEAVISANPLQYHVGNLLNSGND